MTFTTLDNIVRDFIMRRGYTIHWYVPFMVYAKAALRELSFDDLKCINTVLLPVGSYNEVDLPNDYMDYTLVAVKSGQNIKPLVETDSINPLIARDANFDPTTYANIAANTTNQIFYGNIYPFYWNTVTWNNWGEPTGRLYGIGAGVQDDVFSVFPERNQIQLTEHLSVDKIVLQYISNGMSSDAATKITPYAYETISAYISYQMKENTRTYSTAEAQLAKQEYIDQRLILRARMSDLTTERLKRLIQKAAVAAPKS